MNDYERIAQVIRYLDEHQLEQPDLETLAGQVGLSPDHFHRLFSHWAGITPKDFLQCLTVVQIKERLWKGMNVLQASLESGLSGPGRAHDLCVGLEAASPGELKAGGVGWDLRVGMADSPFGRCVIAEGPRGLCYLAFTEALSQSAALAEVQAEWPQARLQGEQAWAERVVAQIFHRSGEGSRLKALVRGTAFQVRVWRALLLIPEGALITYGDLARQIGQPGAARAVGTAVGRNPLSYLIPCHRVIRETGIIGNYRWGATRKQAILAWEGGQNRKH
jgi:AraC family transcriptional regulator of adaptative response/methylated-DNA-[protein]-cysteine methyltransferase